jgi:hypothetical protein
MRIALAWLFLSFATTGVFAQAPTIERIDVLEYGLYTGDETACRRDNLGIQHANGPMCVMRRPH